MNTISYTAQHVIVPTARSYEQVIQAIEQQVGRVDFAALEKIIAAQAPLEAVADAFVGSSTFMYLAKIDQGRILSLSGNKKKCTLYVLGNPLIGNQMHDVTTAVGLYFPFRLCAYEDSQGAVFVTYDVPSSLVQHFKDERLTALARRFDEQLETLARAVTAGQA
jgi:uncharacterized protein (DUF302 family)